MPDLMPFEQRLAGRLVAELDRAIPAFEPSAIARAAMSSRTIGDRVRNRLALGPLPVAPTTRRAALVAVAALLALAMVALLVVAAGRPREVLAFIRTNGDVLVARADGTGERVLFRVAPPVLYTQIEWAPDGRHLAIVDEEFRLTILDMAGVATHQETLALGSSRIEWSPDGQRLAIADGPWLPLDETPCGGPLVHPAVRVIAPDGSRVWTAALPADFRYSAGLGELAWSPTADRLAIVGTTLPCDAIDETLPLGIWVAGVGRTSAAALTPGEPGDIDFQPVWLPDGRLLFSRRSSGLMEVDPGTGATSVFVASADLCDGCGGAQVRIEDRSPDGSRLVLRQTATAPLVLHLVSREVTVVQLERTGFGLTAPSTWAPNGTELLVDFGPSLGGPIAVVAVDVETGRMRDLLTGTRFFAVLD